jgi:hypothetical protein
VSRDWWLGTPGAMQRIKTPRRDLPLVPEQMAADQVSLDNTHTTDRMGKPKHRVILSYEWISTDEADLLDGLYLAGRQPLILLHPEWRNLATTNGSTGTGQTRTTDGFEQTAGSVTTASIATTLVPGVPRLERAVSWLLQTGLAGQSLSHPEPSQPLTKFIPVLLGFGYCASAYVAVTAGSASTQARAEIRWYDGAGVIISATQGSLATLTTAPAWQRVQVTGVPPATAVYAAMAVSTPTNLGAPSTMLATGLQIEYGTTASTWTHGRGVLRCWFADAAVNVPLTGRRSASWTLQEL